MCGIRVGIATGIRDKNWGAQLEPARTWYQYTSTARTALAPISREYWQWPVRDILKVVPYTMEGCETLTICIAMLSRSALPKYYHVPGRLDGRVIYKVAYFSNKNH